MRIQGKKLSNPVSTGGAGIHFETCVQASFITLMLTGGHAPCLPGWPISEIKLQGKVDGFDTDDLIVTVERESGNRRKLIGQIKRSISITKSSHNFGEVAQAAWNDFNNPNQFTQSSDLICLITGPICRTDTEVIWLLNHARSSPATDFFRNVNTANFSSKVKREKLKVLRHHLTIANGGTDPGDETVHEFLRAFYLLQYDLGEEEGVVLSLINSHISQFQPNIAREIWSRILEVTTSRNQHAGRIDKNNLPEELKNYFVTRPVSVFPEHLADHRIGNYNWNQHPESSWLVLGVLVGSWNEKSKNDIESISRFFKLSSEEWITRARKMLQVNGSPLSLNNGIWKMANRIDMWDSMASHIYDEILDKFGNLVVNVLQKPHPAFELPVEKRYAAWSYGKMYENSDELRTGLAEGLAIARAQSNACKHSSLDKVAHVCDSVVRNILVDAEWNLWASLNHILPALAEAAPIVFLDSVEAAMKQEPCPFDELFAQESDGILGQAYITGLLCALEVLAWDEQFLVRVCVALADLASRDPGGQFANRPINSLVTILLPWLPQTQSSTEKREVAVTTLLDENSEVAWNLIIELLPGQYRTSSGSHKPKWRITVSDDWQNSVTNEEYSRQIVSIGKLAVAAAGNDVGRLAKLIEISHCFPEPAFYQLMETLSSLTISRLQEKHRLLLWNQLTRTTRMHRLYSRADWSLREDSIARIENAAERFAPTNLYDKHQQLFTGRDWDLFEKNEEFEEQREKLTSRRSKAVFEILQQYGIEGIIKFAKQVSSPRDVGHALAAVTTNESIQQTLLPRLLNSTENEYGELGRGFIWKRHYDNGWEWTDSVDRLNWTSEQIGIFLTWLPFESETWKRADEWLTNDRREYWQRVESYPFESRGSLDVAIDSFLKHDRPHAAINCLNNLRIAGREINVPLCIRALLDGVHSSESFHVEGYVITELINLLQSELSVDPEDLFKVEWAYLRLLSPSYSGARPKNLEFELSSNPEFFCELIRLIYRSKHKEIEPPQVFGRNTRSIVENAWHLLRVWQTPPGSQKSGTFSEARFKEWLQSVRNSCSDSGHLEVAERSIGEVLIHVPFDPNGLWINRSVATALNEDDAEEMRLGFKAGLYNSRGTYTVDPSGESERNLAKQFRDRAETIENAGFYRLATTLRDLAESYEKEADQVVIEYQNRHR